MDKYLLNTEKKRIDLLFNTIQKNLYQPTASQIKEIFTNLIINNKDSSIEDILNNYIDLLSKEIKSILDNNLTLGLQAGIKNNYFQIETYGGNYLSNNKLKPITKDTLFSLDSISKIFTSIITTRLTRNNFFNLNTTINEINNEYKLNATLESILKFTTCIKTEKRIDYLSTSDTISLLKNCKELISIKNNFNNYYEYNDIGYMILRQTIPSFLKELNNILTNKDITYKNNLYKDNITGGKQNEEYITPDSKGRDIPFPGHTGLYSNLTSILNLFNTIITTEEILTKEEKEQLWKQPYTYPYTYNKLNNQEKCINKITGIYKIPNNLKPNYDKLKLFDMPNNTTINSISSAGTCGSWIMNDNLTTNNMFGNYTTSILTNPYSFVENKPYQEEINNLPNTPLQVSKKGKIIHYSRYLNPYKEILVNYAIILELITEYLKKQDNKIKPKTLTKEIKVK